MTDGVSSRAPYNAAVGRLECERMRIPPRPCSRPVAYQCAKSRDHGFPRRNSAGVDAERSSRASRPEDPETHTVPTSYRTRTQLAMNVAGDMAGAVAMDSEDAQHRSERAQCGLRTETDELAAQCWCFRDQRNSECRQRRPETERMQLRLRSERRRVRTAFRFHAGNGRHDSNIACPSLNGTSRIANDRATTPNRFSTFTRI
jgi:hypothetical protein